MIIVATNEYGMGIDNMDVKLVIQYNIPMSLDLMIQHMSRVGRKDGYLTFVLFTSKWLTIKDQKKIKEQKAKKNNPVKPNKSTQQASPICQVSNTLPKDGGDKSDNKSADRSIVDSVADFEDETFAIDDVDLFGDLIITDINESQQKRKKQQQSSKYNAQKQ